MDEGKVQSSRDQSPSQSNQCLVGSDNDHTSLGRVNRVGRDVETTWGDCAEDRNIPRNSNGTGRRSRSVEDVRCREEKERQSATPWRKGTRRRRRRKRRRRRREGRTPRRSVQGQERHSPM